MQAVNPPSRLRRGVRRLAMAICALIIGAGFTPVLPSTVEPVRPVAVSFNTVAPAEAAAPVSTVDEETPVDVFVRVEPVDAGPLLAGRPVGAVAGRAPPAPLA